MLGDLELWRGRQAEKEDSASVVLHNSHEPHWPTNVRDWQALQL